LDLSPGEEQELSEALAEIHAGRYVNGWEFLGQIKARNRT